jgi:hypothetical protein
MVQTESAFRQQGQVARSPKPTEELVPTRWVDQVAAVLSLYLVARSLWVEGRAQQKEVRPRQEAAAELL